MRCETDSPIHHLWNTENQKVSQISAVNSLFTPLVVVVRHKQLKATYLKRIKNQIGRTFVTPDEHLKQFAVQWKVAT